MTTCATCDDSHRMTLGDRDVPCTHCPLPCLACKQPGGAYCAATPCGCACHAPARVARSEPAKRDSGPAAVTNKTFTWAHLLDLCDDLAEMPAGAEATQELRREIQASVDWRLDRARREQALACLVAAWQRRSAGGSP